MPQSLRQHLLYTLQGLPSVPAYWIAYSGGLDSTVLLHLLASLRDELELKLVALHIDHGLCEHSRLWSEQCRAFSESLGVPIRIERVSISGQQEKGLEAAARQARYAVFEKALGEGEALLSAHHRDDQAETLLLQLLRGGGVHGLAAMPVQRPLGHGLLLRPLLDVPRERLKAYAVEQGLEWIDDPSNFDTSLDRNYLRHTLLPQLAERRGGIREVLARSAGHFAESARLLDELSEMDWCEVTAEEGILSVAALKALSPERCRNLLRFHLRQLGLPLPEHKHLQRILEELLPAAEDAMPLVAWPGAEVRRYRDGLYCMAPLPPLPDSSFSVHWEGKPEVVLPQELGRLRVERRKGQGVSAEKLESGHCEVRLRQGGESIRPVGRRERHALKKLYQEAGVPPWRRARLPLVYLDGELVQVPGFWVAVEAAAGEVEEGIIFHWRPEAIEKEVQNDDN